jgi:hypothetical protein
MMVKWLDNHETDKITAVLPHTRVGCAKMSVKIAKSEKLIQAK